MRIKTKSRRLQPQMNTDLHRSNWDVSYLCLISVNLWPDNCVVHETQSRRSTLINPRAAIRKRRTIIANCKSPAYSLTGSVAGVQQKDNCRESPQLTCLPCLDRFSWTSSVWVLAGTLPKSARCGGVQLGNERKVVSARGGALAEVIAQAH
jgi:hypothetical protein